MAPRVLLINPNSTQATTDMMLAIARDSAGDRLAIEGATARAAPAMITDETALDAAAAEVVQIGVAGRDYAGIIVAAFGDPGLAALRTASTARVVGIAESAMLAATGRFGIVTTTPRLVARIDAYVATLGLANRYAGTQLTDGDPHDLVRDPGRLRDALARAAERSIADGADSIIIGGGPLAEAADALSEMHACPVIAPVRAAAQRLVRELAAREL